jgi:hypothetical protein
MRPLMNSGGNGAGSALGFTIMSGAGLRERLIDARLNVALRLATDGRQLRNDEVPRPLEHPLLPERKRLHVAEVIKMLQNLGNLKDIAGAHLLGEIFEAIFPVIGGSGKVAGQRFEKHVAFARSDRTAQANFRCVGDGNEHEGIRRGEPQRVEGKRYGADLFLLDLFDCPDTVIRVNNFLADLEAHLLHLHLVLRAPGK